MVRLDPLASTARRDLFFADSYIGIPPFEACVKFKKRMAEDASCSTDNRKAVSTIKPEQVHSTVRQPQQYQANINEGDPGTWKPNDLETLLVFVVSKSDGQSPPST